MESEDTESNIDNLVHYIHSEWWGIICKFLADLIFLILTH